MNENNKTMEKELEKLKKDIIQLMTDASEQNGETYEQRCIHINDFESIATSIIPLLKGIVMEAFTDGGIQQRDFIVDDGCMPSVRQYLKETLNIDI